MRNFLFPGVWRGEFPNRPGESTDFYLNLPILCLWETKNEKTNYILKLLFLQTEKLEANWRQDGLVRLYRTAGSLGDRTGLSPGQNRLPTLFDNDQVGSGVCFMSRSLAKQQHYRQNAKEEAHFLRIDLEQLTKLECWFSHVHPELLLSLQQLMNFVLPAIESRNFSKEVTPWKWFSFSGIRYDTRFVGRPLWSIFYFGKKYGLKDADVETFHFRRGSKNKDPATAARMSQEVSFWLVTAKSNCVTLIGVAHLWTRDDIELTNNTPWGARPPITVSRLHF